MFKVPTVRDVVLMVTVRAAVILNVRPTVSPAAVPGTAAGVQLPAVLQFPAALTFQVPLAAWALTPQESITAVIAHFIVVFVLIMRWHPPYARRCALFYLRIDRAG